MCHVWCHLRTSMKIVEPQRGIWVGLSICIRFVCVIYATSQLNCTSMCIKLYINEHYVSAHYYVHLSDCKVFTLIILKKEGMC